LVNSLAGLGFGERIWCWHWEVSNFVMLIRLIIARATSHVYLFKVNMRCCSCNYGLIVLVMFGNFQNWTSRRGESNLENFQTSLVLLILNCTLHRMITYTNIILLW
jgi:hypothetical protein